MNINIDNKTALLLIDIQKGFNDVDYWGGGRNNNDAEQNAAKLLGLWREKNMPIFHIKHCSTEDGSILEESNAGNEFMDIVKPEQDEAVIKKNVNSAFIGTDLKQRLFSEGIKKVVIVGLTTDHCVSTSARMAGNLGFETYLVSDAIATFDKVGVDGTKYSAQLIHDTALASLNQEFATIVNFEDILHKLI